MKCPSCNINPAIIHSTYGALPCDECNTRHKSLVKPQRQVEFTTQDIKEQRQQFADDIIQPFRKGQFSKEYYEKHGTKGIQVSEKEIKNAKNVWVDEHYYS